MFNIANRVRNLFHRNGHNGHTERSSVLPVRPETALEERQALLAHHVRIVARKLSNGLFCFGSKAGLGKTRCILRTLASEGVKPVILNGHCTPLALYQNLFYNPNEIIFIDDCDSLYRNLPALGILRSALWGDNGDARLVTYNSSQLKIPQSFEFTGRIICTANTLPRKNHAFEAVLSRIDIFELDASNDEVLELMRHLARQGFENLSAEECLEIVEFIEDNSSSRALSLRLLEPSYRKYLYARSVGIDWRDLVRNQLEQIGQEAAKPLESKAFDLACFQEVKQEFPGSIKDQEESWLEKTGKSRATFYRLKRSQEEDTA